MPMLLVDVRFIADNQLLCVAHHLITGNRRGGWFHHFWRVCSPQKGLKSADQMRVEKGAMVLVLHEQNSLIQTNLASLCSMRRGINLLLFSA
jgi:hypothetical protein